MCCCLVEVKANGKARRDVTAHQELFANGHVEQEVAVGSRAAEQDRLKLVLFFHGCMFLG